MTEAAPMGAASRCICHILFAYSGYAGEYLAFDSLKKSASSGRYIAYLVCKAELVHTCDRVTATDKRESSVIGSFYDCICYGT